MSKKDIIPEEIAMVPYITIPAYIYRSKLSDTAQKICGLILALSSEYGYCFASNRYIANLFKRESEDLEKKERAVAKMIQRLLKDQWVQNIGKSNRNRKLVLVNPDELKVQSVDGQKTTSSRFRDKKTTSSRDKNDLKSQLLPYYNILYKYNVQILQNGQVKTLKDLENLEEKKILDTLFNIFWQNYPRREQRLRALKIFKKLDTKVLTTLIKIMHLIPIRFKDTEKKYIPLPATFLNAGSYEDEIFKKLEVEFSEKNFKKRGEELKNNTDVELVVDWVRAFLGGYEATKEESEAVGKLGVDAQSLRDYATENGITKTREWLYTKVGESNAR